MSNDMTEVSEHTQQATLFRYLESAMHERFWGS